MSSRLLPFPDQRAAIARGMPPPCSYWAIPGLTRDALREWVQKRQPAMALPTSKDDETGMVADADDRRWRMVQRRRHEAGR